MHKHTPAASLDPVSESGGPPAVRVAVAGATGYAGQELVRILARHPAVRLVAAMSSGARAEPRPLPALARIWNGTVVPLSIDTLGEVEVVFLALPDSAAADVAPALVARGVRVIDLSGAFRLREASARARWYPDTKLVPDGVAYGLTELARAEVRRARLIANPGCYPTAAVLALQPLVSAGLLTGDVIVDAKSGVSGAGKAPSERTHFSECHGNVSAYGVFSHRHAPEIEQGLMMGMAGTTVTEAAPAPHVTFVPHLVPLDRGILSTMYARVPRGVSEQALADVYGGAYADAPFVRLVGGALPEIKHVVHSNFCDIGWRVDAAGRAVIVSALDNLVKGAAGQAVQNLNVVLGLDERTGLPA